MNDNNNFSALAFAIRIIALGMALYSTYNFSIGRMDNAIYSMIAAIFFELYNLETRLRK